MDSKTCRVCGQTKPLAEYHRKASGRGGYSARCKACVLAQQREYRQRPAAYARRVTTRREYRQRPDVLEREASRVRAYRNANRDRLLAARREHRAANPERCRAQDRNAWLRTKYGIDQAEYDRMNTAQGGVCAICSQPPPADAKNPGNRVLHVDHDHGTGRVRGLLCHTCNKGIGGIGDANLPAAAAYIERTMGGAES